MVASSTIVYGFSSCLKLSAAFLLNNAFLAFFMGSEKRVERRLWDCAELRGGYIMQEQMRDGRVERV